MSSPPEYDLVIIGAGTAGLLLLLALKHKNYPGKVAVLERNAASQDERILSFWYDDALPPYLQHIIVNKWPTWQFSSDLVSRQMNSERHPYCAIRFSALRRLAQAATTPQQCFSVLYDCQVLSVDAGDQHNLLDTTLGKIIATQVVDTRPPPLHYQHHGLFQCFFGVEVQTQQDRFDTSRIALMQEVKHSAQGIEFIYILPFSARHALIELTCFSDKIINPNVLKKQLQPLLSSLLEQQPFEIEREEAAVLPMYAVNANFGNRHTRLTYGGIAGGAMRASTGYSLLNSQRWADTLSGHLMQNVKIRATPPIKWQYHLLDALFLRVLRTKPQLGVTLYAALFSSLEPELFIRFMSERASWGDLFKVVWAMPKWTFLRALAQSYLPFKRAADAT